LALKDLRARFKLPFVGTVPAIKPACAQSKSKRVAVLGTQATVSREYTRALIREFAAGCDVDLVGSSHLAAFAEAEFAGKPVADAAINEEIAGCFVDADGRRTDTVVLACTHYPLLTERFKANAPWPVDWLNPAPAIARRVGDLLRNHSAGSPPPPQIVFTSGRAPSPPRCWDMDSRRVLIKWAVCPLLPQKQINAGALVCPLSARSGLGLASPGD